MSESRYARMTTNGVTRRVRAKATLRVDAIALLKTSGPLPKRRIMNTLRTAQRTIDAALAEAERAGELEYFLMRSSRGRMDEFWCIAGTARDRQKYRFRGAEILAAFQRAATELQQEITS
ncbi:hypothetical protein AB4Y43_07120 [Paraburkholderia sp. BR10872]|uniref:hypothetical protein n=1 Tax=Paraburkholderia sp. BR10872 TaxID=3236989 RepID=UPI0034D24174